MTATSRRTIGSSTSRAMPWGCWTLGRTEAALLAGHDFGASVAAWAALIRPDIFHKLALMSAPFRARRTFRRNRHPRDRSMRELAALDRPRKHYPDFANSAH